MSKFAGSLGKSWGPFLTFWGPVVLLLVLGFWITSKFVEPAPPKSAVIITGREGGDYYAVAQQYAKVFKANGIDLIVRPSAGAVENYQQLLKPEGDVDLAIVQGGTLPDDPTVKEKIEGICSLYFEPLWVFYRTDRSVGGMTPLTLLSQLRSKTIAVGEDGSGTKALAIQLLTDSGVTNDPKLLLPIGGATSADALKKGDIDAAMFISSPTSPLIRELIQTPNVALASLAQTKAMARRRQYLSAVTLYRGSIDLAENLPAEDVDLIAPAAMLVARESAHKALILLGAMAATDTHKAGTLLSDPGQFPSARYVEVPMAKEAQHFLEKGPSILQRIFPFWLASLLDRMLIMLLPLATLLIPLVRLAPPLYVWRTRARIYRWYREIRTIDGQMGPEATPESLAGLLKQIARIDNEVRSVHVPLSYMEELYQLRVHLNLLEETAKERTAANVNVGGVGAGG
ncbi:TAXI family TRAP transporter solute-binding subunit [soil metagenome]